MVREKKGRRRLQLPSEWKLLAQGGCANQKSDIPRDCFGLLIWLSLVGPKLEAGSRETNQQTQKQKQKKTKNKKKTAKLADVDQVLTIVDQLLQRLQFGSLGFFCRSESHYHMDWPLFCLSTVIQPSMAMSGNSKLSIMRMYS